jgi:hypothetical protein
MSLTIRELEAAFETKIIKALPVHHSHRLRPSTNWSTEKGRTQTRIVSHRDSPLDEEHITEFVVYHMESFLDKNPGLTYKFHLEWRVQEEEVVLRFQPE